MCLCRCANKKSDCTQVEWKPIVSHLDLHYNICIFVNVMLMVTFSFYILINIYIMIKIALY